LLAQIQAEAVTTWRSPATATCDVVRGTDRLRAWSGGFSLHAGVVIADHDREALERLARYGARPALAHDRLTWTSDGRISYKLKRPWPDGEIAERQIARDIAADPKVQAAAGQLRAQGEAIRSELVLAASDLQTIFGAAHRLWCTRRAPQRMAVALLCGAPVLVGALTWAYASAAGSLVPLLATVAAGIAAVRHAAAPVKQLLERATARVDQLEAEARAKKTAKETEFEAEHVQLSTRIAELEKQHAAIDQQERELAAQLAELQKADKRSLQDFILKRASSDDYRKNLGVVSAVHKDFKELAEFLKPGGSPPHVERIILYIDDLDRCTPSRVVEVLQAIHVILSLPLFVVVVGVDSQWLLDSLTTYYRRQFRANAEVMDAARPQQYLEKIFQIPFTLLPMAPTGYERLVASLLQRQTATASGTPPPTRTRDASGERAAETGSGPRGAAPADPARRASPHSGGNPRIDLQPRGLELEPRELKHIATLSALVGSPRSAKRLVNLYRILRSTLDDDSLDQFVDGGGHEIALICLAIVIGNPALSADLFRDILAGAVQTPAALSAWCTKRATGASGRERVTLIEIERRSAAFTDWPAVLAAVRRVARFSFETGRVLRAHLAGTAVQDKPTQGKRARDEPAQDEPADDAVTP
jgi:hypothetical protein